MGAGVGIFLLALGAILFWAVEVNIPGIEDNTLGVILMVAGAAGVLIGLLMSQRRGGAVQEERQV